MRDRLWVIVAVGLMVVVGCKDRAVTGGAQGQPGKPPTARGTETPRETPAASQPVGAPTAKLTVGLMVKLIHSPPRPDVTGIEIELPKDYGDRIAEVKVKGPKGPLKIGKDDFTCVPATLGGTKISCEHRADKAPDLGTYAVTLTTRDGRQATATDAYKVKRLIPPPEVMDPKPKAKVEDSAPTFRWAATKYQDVPLYYSLDIFERDPRKTGAPPSRVYKSPTWEKDKLSETVPAGILKPNMAYKLRVRVADGATWPRQNQSFSEWRLFTTDERLH